MIGKRIYLRRIELQLTLNQLADKTGLDQGYLSRVENEVIKKCNVKTVAKISRALEVSPAWLIGLSDRKK